MQLRSVASIAVLLAVWSGLSFEATARQAFRIAPYLQHPGLDAMTVRWFADDSVASVVEVRPPGESPLLVTPEIVRADALVYDAWELDQYFGGIEQPPPYRYTARITGLEPGATVPYAVQFGGTRYEATFRTAPAADRPVRLIVYGDPETEPESVGDKGGWWELDVGLNDRRYLIDQDQGYRENLGHMRERAPDLVLIAGDLVRIGQEQRDWDAFWTYQVDPRPDRSLASFIPVLAVPGNHDYLSPHGPDPNRTYDQPQAEASIRRYLTYFEFPDNGAPYSEQRGRYWRLDYGPVTLIGLDVNNQSPDGSDLDTNHFMSSVHDGETGWAPDFGPGSAQYAWLEDQLASAQQVSRFTFVLLHHVPFSSSLHGLPPGFEEGSDPLSGVPVRLLLPLLGRYGVDAVLAGHGEIFERFTFEATEERDEGPRDHEVQVYDVGVGGDDLRGPGVEVSNPNRQWIAARDAPEFWEGERLVDGGRHYGHLEINVAPSSDGGWEARLEPVYVFPLFDETGSVFLGTERRVYDDVRVLHAPAAPVSEAASDDPVSRPTRLTVSPNPASNRIRIRWSGGAVGRLVRLFDALGRVVLSLEPAPGEHELEVDVSDLSPGAYVARLETQAGVWSELILVAR